MASRQQKPVETTPEEPSAPRGMLPLVDIAGLVLIALRWFTPTEGTFRGDTLWISQLWLGWGILAAWSAVRQRDRWMRLGGIWTAGFGLLVAGHIVSGLAVVATEGQKRAAINGLWEWVSIGVAGIWFHHRATSSDFRRTFRITLIASAVGLSGLGIWQRWVTQPELGRMVTEFDELEAKLPTLDGMERTAAQRRYRALSEALGQDYIALDAEGRRGMRQRLLESSEPLGRFALANSLAAFLLVGLMLVAGEALALWYTNRQQPAATPSPARSVVPLVVVTVLIAFVLLLTKSRTAWAGWLAGGVLLVALSAQGRVATFAFRGLLASLFIGILVVITWAAGGLDRLVLAEAPKSLEYRMEYWIGAWRVIQQHPWIGIGPGNFRQHYLAHKLAKSSEEVLDPHNFLLDAWATAGLAGITGLVLLTASCLRACRRPISSDPDPAAASWRSSAPAVVLGATLLLAGLGWWLDNVAEWELAATAAVALVAAIALNRIVPSAILQPAVDTEVGTLAAWLALSVHLLGAGGMEMPAIIQLWICLSSLIVAPRSKQPGSGRSVWPAQIPAAVLAFCILAFLGQARTATGPWLTARSGMNLAHADAIAGGRFERVDEYLQDATTGDRFDPEPWRQRSQLAFREWERTRDAGMFDKAIEAQQAAIARDPVQAHDLRALADLHLRRFAFDHRPENAAAAVDAARQALALYPNHLVSRRLLAEALAAGGRTAEAAEAARHALELDALWLELGHYDKVLTPEARQQLQELARAR